MVVGVDAREAAGPAPTRPIGAAGRGRYVREVLTRLPARAPETRFVLYTNAPPELDGLPPNAEWRPLPGGGLTWHGRVGRRARRECDLYFSTASYLTPFFLGPYVQTVYDLIPFRPAALPHGRAGRIERLTLRRALRGARAIVTISKATAGDLCELLPEVEEKVTVTPLAADARFRPDVPAEEVAAVRRRHGLPETFVLSIGTIEPRKNLTRLVEAFAALPDATRRDCGLVLAGRKGWGYEPVFEAIAARGDDRIVHLDFVPEDDLPALYAAATVFCYPSLYEGFGLPVLEAMQAGTPVVTSNVSSLPEVGGDAVRYADPYDVDDLAAALDELLGDEARRDELRRAGLERAREFSWERTAERTLEVLRAAA
jgi:glycosyltransferase involved in cell wall biosynthesis